MPSEWTVPLIIVGVLLVMGLWAAALYNGLVRVRTRPTSRGRTSTPS